jgi:hypothetical protein
MKCKECVTCSRYAGTGTGGISDYEELVIEEHFLPTSGSVLML